MSLIFAAASAAGGKPQTGALIFLLVAAAILVLVPVVLFWMAARVKGKAKAAEAWPTAAGTVTKASIFAHRSRKAATSYQPQFAYEYQVDGKALTGQRLRFGWVSFRSEAAALAAMKGLTAGAPLQVRYNPKDPSDSTATTDVSAGNFTLVAWIFVGITVVFGAVAAAALLK